MRVPVWLAVNALWPKGKRRHERRIGAFPPTRPPRSPCSQRPSNLIVHAGHHSRTHGTQRNPRVLTTAARGKNKLPIGGCLVNRITPEFGPSIPCKTAIARTTAALRNLMRNSEPCNRRANLSWPMREIVGLQAPQRSGPCTLRDPPESLPDTIGPHAIGVSRLAIMSIGGHGGK